MRNLIPIFIQDKYKTGIFYGEFEAAAMFVDVSGFTSMTEKLMRQGKVGAEEISKILNEVFSPVIDAVYSAGGYITVFAGDAFTAIFPGTNILSPFISATEIQRIFKGTTSHKTEYGTFEISAKIGLSYGRVNWGIPGYDKHRAYYFSGEAIDGCAHSEHHCTARDIIADKKILEALGPCGDLTLEETADPLYFRLKENNLPAASNKNEALHILNIETASLFYPEPLFEQDSSGEFRDIVPVFISFASPESFDILNEFIIETLQTVDMLGGYFNSLDFGDKGGNMLILFGAPISFENNVQRAISFISILKEKIKIPFRCGITQGEVYAGFVGSDRRATYTVLGDRVNLSARFMMKANWGEIWLSEMVSNKIEEKYNVKNLGEHLFKGKAEPIKVFQLLDAKMSGENLVFENEIIGREKEIAECLKFCIPLTKGANAGIQYIYGDPGIGKTRLFAASRDSLDFECRTHILAADSMLRKSMNPFSAFFTRYFELIENGNPEENRHRFDKRWNKIIEELSSIASPKKDEVIEELIRTKSFLGALVSVTWKDSLYEKLDAKGRFENMVYGVKEFFKAESLIKPLILVFDDFQWLDSDSHEILKAMFRQTESFPIAIFLLSRLNDDGSKPAVATAEKIIKNELTLDRLPQASVEIFVHKLLGAPAHTDLLSFVMKRSEGNPFYVEQFCMYLRDNSLLKFTNGLYETISNNIEVPTEVNAILISRIDRLSSKLKEAVFTAAVIGREVDVKILTETLRGRDVEPILSEGKSERIWNSVSELIYIFRNLLLREAAYDMQLRSRLKSLHKMTAEAIERNYGTEEKFFSDMAFHYEKAEEKEKTIYYLSKAGDYSKEHYQNDDALRLYNKLLTYLEDKPEIIKIKHKAGAVYKLIGKWAEAEAFFRESLDLAREIENESMIADSMKELGHMLLEKGNYDDSRKLLDEALIAYEKTDNIKGRCFAIGFIGLIYYYKGELDNAVEYFNKRLELSKKIEDRANIGVSYRYLGGVAYYRADYKMAQEYYSQVLNISESINAELDIAVAKLNLGLTYQYLNDFDNALKYYRESLAVYQKFGSKFYIAYTANNMGEVYYWMGNYEEATKAFLEQLNIAAELGNSRHIAMANTMLGNVQKKLGKFEEAFKYYNTAIKIAEELSLKNLLCEFYFEKAELLFEMGKDDESKALNAEALKIGETVGRKDFSFKSRILEIRRLAITNKEASSEELRKMLRICDDNDGSATIFYYLYSFTGNTEFKEKALNLYKDLFKTAPRAIYKTRIDELSNQ